MRLLVLGGTRFVGRAIVADALAHGVEVTLFGRGRTGPELFPGVARLIGDCWPATGRAPSTRWVRPSRPHWPA